MAGGDRGEEKNRSPGPAGDIGLYTPDPSPQTPLRLHRPAPLPLPARSLLPLCKRGGGALTDGEKGPRLNRTSVDGKRIGRTEHTAPDPSPQTLLRLHRPTPLRLRSRSHLPQCNAGRGREIGSAGICCPRVGWGRRQAAELSRGQGEARGPYARSSSSAQRAYAVSISWGSAWDRSATSRIASASPR